MIRLAKQHPDWVVGFADEVWWSRLAQPDLHTWPPDQNPLRLIEKTLAQDDADRKALACYGVLWRATPSLPEQVWLRFASGQPISELTTQFLGWCCAQLAKHGVYAWLLIWDNASWHISQAVRGWIRTHNQRVKHTGQGVRIVPCQLPSKSPWLNPIEPKWVHGKRAVVEPDRVLTATELEARVCAYYGCQPEYHLVISEKAA